MESKKCTKCGKVKRLDEFYNQKDGKYGKMSICKTCGIIIRKKYYKTHKNSIIKRQKEWYKKNKERIKDKCNHNTEYRKNYNKEYVKKNKDKIKKYQKEYKEKMKKILNCKARVYRRKNIKKFNKRTKLSKRIYREKLHNCYIRSLFADSNKYPIERKYITQKLIEIKRRIIIIKRLIKQKRQK